MGRNLGLIMTFLLVLSLLLPIAVIGASAVAQTPTPTPPPPTLTSVSPNSGFLGQTLTVSIYGNYLTAVTAVSFGAGIIVNGFAVNSSSWIGAAIFIPYDATPGPRDVSVTTPGGAATLKGGFTVSQIAVSIQLLSPKGGEAWEIGTKHRITWTSSGLVLPTDLIGIELSRDGGFTWETIISATANTGFADWVVTGPPTAQARIKVFGATSPGVSSSSAANFTIFSPFIRVIFPYERSQWQVGTKQKITWFFSHGAAGDVTIYLSRDGGATWTPISPAIRDTGSWTWQVTGPATDQAEMEVVAASGTSGVSREFSIVSASITVTSPSAGDVWEIGTRRTISWESEGLLTGKVSIQLSRDGGETWKTIVSSTKNDGFYTWKVTRPPTDQARIKVLSLFNPGVFGISDGDFIISGRDHLGHMSFRR